MLIDAYSCRDIGASVLRGTGWVANSLNPNNGPKPCLRLAAIGFLMLHSSNIVWLMAQALTSSEATAADTTEMLAMPLESDESALWVCYRILGIGLMIGGAVGAIVQTIAPQNESQGTLPK